MRTQKITFLLAGLLFCWSGVLAKYTLNVSCDNTITAIADGNTGPYYFTWTGPNGDILNPNENTINQISALQPGIYSVIITNNYGCDSILKVNIGNASCKLDEVQARSKLSIYPNPFSNGLLLDFESEIDIAGQLQITDLIGKAVYEKNVSFLKGDNSYQIDLDQNLSKGVYILNLQIGEQPVRTIKMIKE